MCLHFATQSRWSIIVFVKNDIPCILRQYLDLLNIECVWLELDINKASQAIQSPRTVPFFLLVSLLDGYSFPNVLVKGIVAFTH